MSTERHCVIYAVDRDFWVHTYVSIYSLLVNNLDVAFDIRIMSLEPDRTFFKHTGALHEAHPAVEVRHLPVAPQLIADAPLKIDHTSPATYYRLALDRLLPEVKGRVLYLDGDTVVRAALDEIFQMDISNDILVAVPDYVPFDEQPPLVPHSKRMGWPAHQQYFNAGVLYINLDLWREHNVYQQSLEYITKNALNPSRLNYQDQDVLNGVLAGKWKSIGPYFNYHPWSIDSQRHSYPSPCPQIGDQIPAGGPAIAHYTGSIKPWHGGSPHPYRHDYWKYRMQTPYAHSLLYARSRATDMLFKPPWGMQVRRAQRVVSRRVRRQA